MGSDRVAKEATKEPSGLSGGRPSPVAETTTPRQRLGAGAPGTQHYETLQRPGMVALPASHRATRDPGGRSFLTAALQPYAKVVAMVTHLGDQEDARPPMVASSNARGLQ